MSSIKRNILKKTRVYLSGPMDFVGSRVIEKYFGWRALLSPVLKALGSTVLDPWNKPLVKGHQDYGKEGLIASKEEYARDFWTNPETRARFETDFWETVHIDLRMTDVADFLIAFCPTNIYSVGTVHEIITARNQMKPTLVISPPVKYEYFPEIMQMSEDAKKRLKFYGLKENPSGIPSQWYGNIVGGNYFFDGFGWENLQFKKPNFYEELVENVINLAKPNDDSSEDFVQWQQVANWIEQSDFTQNLKGGIFDHQKVLDVDSELLENALLEPKEQKRQYFWYNSPYKPHRPLLYHLFSIASGHIPPRLNIIPKLDENGELTYERVKFTDDSWLLLSFEPNRE